MPALNSTQSAQRDTRLRPHDYRPAPPPETVRTRYGIGVVGCGSIALAAIASSEPGHAVALAQISAPAPTGAHPSAGE